MQGSAMMALRAFVLLVCLVAVPVFAIFGKNAIEVVKGLIHNYTSASPANVSATTRSSDPPVFRPGLIAPTATHAAAESKSGRSPVETTHGSGTDQWPAALSGNQPPRSFAETPAAGTRSNDSAVPARLLDAASTKSSAAPLQPPASDLRPIAGDSGAGGSVIARAPHQEGARSTARREPSQNASPESKTSDAAAPAFSPDLFHTAEQRLRDLGATYYLLETLGPGANRYRFYCKIAASREPEQVLAFFATENDPLSAMNNVVRQVEDWRAHVRQ